MVSWMTFTRRCAPWVLLAAPILLFGWVHLTASETPRIGPSPPPTLEDVQISSGDDVEVIVFVASGEGLSCSLKRLEDPPRLVLDFPGARNLIREQPLPTGMRLLSDMRIEEVGLGAERRTQVLLDLKHPVQVDMARAPGLVTLLLHPEPQGQSPAVGMAELAPSGEAAAPAGELIPLFLAEPGSGRLEAEEPATGRGEKDAAAQIDFNPGEIPLGPHDLLTVKVFGVESLDRRTRIGSDGTLSLPLVGELPAAGMTRRELEVEISRRLADGFIRDPQVSVLVEEYLSRQISISGAVRSPGAVELLRPTTLLEILALAGGILHSRASEEILIVRQQADGPPRSIRVLRGPLEAGRLEENMPVQPGDLIHVPFEEMLEVLVRGRVRQPDRYRVPVSDGVTVLQAVMLAGGTTDGHTGRRAEILRHQENGQAVTLKINLKRIRDGKDPDLPLEANDIIVVH